MIFEWSVAKAGTNLKKHGISFDDAVTVFQDPLALTFPDPDHAPDDRREITIGHTIRQQFVFVAHCERGERIRIISTRLVTRSERRQYATGIDKES